jgi:molybdopterin synthase catalytic subunit
MDLNGMIERIKRNPHYPKMGMIASHLGVVRQTSLTGKKVQGIEVAFDEIVVQEIKQKISSMPGIFHVLIETSQGPLRVGDAIMAVVVGGDTREHVFPALIAAVEEIKEKASTKREILAEEQT